MEVEPALGQFAAAADPICARLHSRSVPLMQPDPWRVGLIAIRKVRCPPQFLGQQLLPFICILSVGRSTYQVDTALLCEYHVAFVDVSRAREAEDVDTHRMANVVAKVQNPHAPFHNPALHHKLVRLDSTCVK